MQPRGDEMNEWEYTYPRANKELIQQNGNWQQRAYENAAGGRMNKG